MFTHGRLKPITHHPPSFSLVTGCTNALLQADASPVHRPTLGALVLFFDVVWAGGWDVAREARRNLVERLQVVGHQVASVLGGKVFGGRRTKYEVRSTKYEVRRREYHHHPHGIHLIIPPPSSRLPSPIGK
ncbi:hypothetical protein Hypma_003144 [Hypsizygus marmoreus]|uniref:Uncharacterized protein n=1 Tax=Hypsizygus marmoreus TaxID=39966 RepID=A0A369J2G8_HYPMA|nr:hypothetical protein Hypma_003144 [Hypsizygus marmoreus]